MNSFISYFKQVPAFGITVLLVILIEVGLYFIPNLHYLESGGSFFTYYKKQIAEDKTKNFDIVLLGDSRSLSINGVKEGEGEYSIYNFSLPAAGSRYFKFFLKKYLENHPKPKLVIFAADPEQYHISKIQKFDLNKNLWNQYKHRLLNLFTFKESFEQYSGGELVFIAKEYLPLVMYSFKFRQGFADILSGLKMETLTSRESYHTRQNHTIELITSNHNGQINLGDYFIADEAEVAKSYLKYVESLNSIYQFDLSNFVDFLEYCKESNIQVLVLNIPRADGLNQTKFFQLVIPAMKEEIFKFPNAAYKEFPQMDYGVNLFSEAIHYNTQGEKKLNADFKNQVYPEIISHIKNLDKGTP